MGAAFGATTRTPAGAAPGAGRSSIVLTASMGDPFPLVPVLTAGTGGRPD
jgi:hypothetical protein